MSLRHAVAQFAKYLLRHCEKKDQAPLHRRDAVTRKRTGLENRSEGLHGTFD